MKANNNRTLRDSMFNDECDLLGVREKREEEEEEKDVSEIKK